MWNYAGGIIGSIPVVIMWKNREISIHTYIHTCIYICLHFHCERYIILKKALMNLFMNSDELND